MEIISRRVNPETDQKEVTFNAKLLSVSKDSEGEFFMRSNSNGTEFGLGTIEYVDHEGTIVQRVGQIWKKQIERVEAQVGNEVLCTASLGEDSNTGEQRVYIKISHLVGGARPTMEEFADAFAFEAEEVEQTASTEVQTAG